MTIIVNIRSRAKRNMSKLTADFFAYRQYRDYVIYKMLAGDETDLGFKKTLEELIKQEWDDYQFWLQFSENKKFRVGRWQAISFKLIRRFLGLTFAAKILEGREKEMIENYTRYLSGVKDEKIRAGIAKILEHERHHEKELIEQIHEGKIKFLGNIILGLNDGLVELTGALVGFSFVLGSHTLVALTGLVTGIAASLSMASSAYVQALYENRKDAKRAAVYTGAAYLIVVGILVSPYFLLTAVNQAVILMLALALTVIFVVSLYGSIIFERNFSREFARMALMSLGVAAVTFSIGLILRKLFGVAV